MSSLERASLKYRDQVLFDFLWKSQRSQFPRSLIHIVGKCLQLKAAILPDGVAPVGPAGFRLAEASRIYYYAISNRANERRVAVADQQCIPSDVIEFGNPFF